MKGFDDQITSFTGSQSFPGQSNPFICYNKIETENQTVDSDIEYEVIISNTIKQQNGDSSKQVSQTNSQYSNSHQRKNSIKRICFKLSVGLLTIIGLFGIYFCINFAIYQNLQQNKSEISNNVNSQVNQTISNVSKQETLNIQDNVYNQTKKISEYNKSYTAKSDQYCKKCNNFPDVLPRYSSNVKPQELQQLRKRGLSSESLQIARKYALNGLQQPDQYWVEYERNYYQHKYELITQSEKLQQLPLCIVIPSYNNVVNNRYKFNLNSIFRQEYQNYRVIYFDDHSTDQTGKFVQEYIDLNAPDPKKFTVIVNSQRKSALANNYQAGINYCNENSIFIVGPDGDDGLAGKLVFKLYNYFFQKYDIWVSWGQYLLTSNGRYGHSRTMTQQQMKVADFRNLPFFTSHLKAFYTKLWHQLSKEELLDAQGKYFDKAQDVAIMVPILEMSRKKAKFIAEICYIYVNNHQNSQIRYGIDSLDSVTNQIRSKNRRQQLSCLVQDRLNGQSVCVEMKNFVLNQMEKARKITKNAQQSKINS